MSKSHDPRCVCVCVSHVRNSQFPLSSSLTSAMMCHSGCPPEQDCKSQENALCPLSRNALQTSCDSSQAIRTFISQFLHRSHIQSEILILLVCFPIQFLCKLETMPERFNLRLEHDDLSAENLFLLAHLAHGFNPLTISAAVTATANACQMSERNP